MSNVRGNSTASPTIVGDAVLIAASTDREGGGGGGSSGGGGGGTTVPGNSRPSVARPGELGSLVIRLGGIGDVTTTHVRWKSAKVTAGYATPVVEEGLAYFVSRVGNVQCVDLTDGTIRWQHRLPGSAWASPIVHRGKVFFFCKDGAVVVLKAGASLEEVGESSLSATDVVYGVAAVEEAWLVRTGRSLILIKAD